MFTILQIRKLRHRDVILAVVTKLVSGKAEIQPWQSGSRNHALNHGTRLRRKRKETHILTRKTVSHSPLIFIRMPFWTVSHLPCADQFVHQSPLPTPPQIASIHSHFYEAPTHRTLAVLFYLPECSFVPFWLVKPFCPLDLQTSFPWLL